MKVYTIEATGFADTVHLRDGKKLIPVQSGEKFVRFEDSMESIMTHAKTLTGLDMVTAERDALRARVVELEAELALSHKRRGLMQEGYCERVKELTDETKRLGDLMLKQDNDFHECHTCERVDHIDEMTPSIDEEGGQCGYFCEPCGEAAPRWRHSGDGKPDSQCVTAETFADLLPVLGRQAELDALRARVVELEKVAVLARMTTETFLLNLTLEAYEDTEVAHDARVTLQKIRDALPPT